MKRKPQSLQLKRKVAPRLAEPLELGGLLETVFENDALLQEVTQWMSLETLLEWRLCSKKAHLAWRRTFFTKEGWPRKVWCNIERLLGENCTRSIQKMMRATGALVTGSTVLQCLEGSECHWQAQDVDVILALTSDNVSHIVALIKELLQRKEGDPSPYPDLAAGTMPRWGLHCQIQNPTHSSQELNPHIKRLYKELEGAQQEAGEKKCVARYYCDSFCVVTLVATEPLWVTHQQSRTKIDFIFVEPSGAEGTLWGWIREFFDLDVCANALSENSLWCKSPKGIATGKAVRTEWDPCCRASTCKNPLSKEMELKFPGNVELQTAIKSQLLAALQAFTQNPQMCEDDIGRGCVCAETRDRRQKKYEGRGYTVDRIVKKALFEEKDP